MPTTPRRLTLAALAGAGVVIALLAWPPRRDVIVYNGSDSVPTGFYVRSDEPIRRGAIVTVRARDVALAYAEGRRFTDTGDRFLKRVAAMAGDQVCAEDDMIAINACAPLRRMRRDRFGRALPRWSGCRTLEQNEVFLLGDTPDSFDARYWGPVSTATIEGVWRPLCVGCNARR
jgi:conjugative transfer signal peptidase TraF